MFLFPAHVYISHIFTWFPSHPKLGEFLSWPPPASHTPGEVRCVGGTRKGAKESCKGSGGSQGTAYFYSWLKNIFNFSKFRSLRPAGQGPVAGS